MGFNNSVISLKITILVLGCNSSPQSNPPNMDLKGQAPTNRYLHNQQNQQQGRRRHVARC